MYMYICKAVGVGEASASPLFSLKLQVQQCMSTLGENRANLMLLFSSTKVQDFIVMRS